MLNSTEEVIDMNRSLVVAAIVCAVAAGPSVAADEGSEPAAGTRVDRLAVCLRVEDRTPVGEAESFPSDVGRLWCFTQVETPEPPVQVFHRWYIGERLVNEIPIEVKGQRWRCWSRKTIRPSWTGPCRVEIATEAGDVLATQAFTLEPATGRAREETEAPEAHE